MSAGTTSARLGTEPGVPEPPALYERFTVTYPSGTVIPSFYAGGATLGEVRVTHPLAKVEAVEDPLAGVGSPRMKGIHCALQGRLGADVQLRRSKNGKDLVPAVRGRRRGPCGHVGVGLGLRGEGPSAREARQGR